MNETKERSEAATLAAVAVGVVDRLKMFSAIHKSEILAIAGALVQVQINREARDAQTRLQPKDE